jgi:hypothetical protein
MKTPLHTLLARATSSHLLSTGMTFIALALASSAIAQSSSDERKALIKKEESKTIMQRTTEGVLKGMARGELGSTGANAGDATKLLWDRYQKSSTDKPKPSTQPAPAPSKPAAAPSTPAPSSPLPLYRGPASSPRPVSKQ